MNDQMVGGRRVELAIFNIHCGERLCSFPISIRDSYTSSVSHVGPIHPIAQEHVKPLTPSVHVPPLLQGSFAHSLILIWQLAPLYPGAHSQVYVSCLLDVEESNKEKEKERLEISQSYNQVSNQN